MMNTNPNIDKKISFIGTLISSGKIEEAELHSKKAIELNPSLSSPYVNLGNVFYKKGKLYEAELNYKKAISLLILGGFF